MLHAQDTIVKKKDSLAVALDTLKQKNKSELGLTSKVVYSAKDSIMFSISEQKVYLYGNAKIEYEDIVLTAAYIEIMFQKSEIFARGITDSAGKKIGRPQFTQNEETFQSENMTYNFKTKKGIIKQVITKDGENFVHGKVVKRMGNGEINVKNGQFTTCSLEEPHYQIKFYKAKVIPNKKIVTGPAYLVIEDVPIPIGVPFGFFPNKKGQKTGILFPTYGESTNRGFFLENGGYYIPIGEHMDLALRGDIYTHGSWAAKVASNYKKRYKYDGNISMNYAINIIGEKGLSDYQQNKDFFVRWNHNQDVKARPNSRFSANVNAGSSKYNEFNPSSTSDYLSNTFQSNVSYSTTIAGKYNLSANMRHSQNTITKTVDLSLPELTFSANRFYPFRPKARVGASKWYDNISVNYTMSARNSLSTFDSLLFDKSSLSKFKNGMNHQISTNNTTKIFKYLSWSNTINFNDRWYLQSIERNWSNEMYISNSDTLYGRVKTDTINGFKAAHDFSLSSSLNTKLYGFLKLKKGPFRVIRHVMTPSVSFVFTPDFGSQFWGYYKYYIDTTYHNDPKKLKKYSIFETGIFGTPPPSKSGSVNLSISNNLEIKVRNNKDSITGLKKITLIENLTISTSYDVAKDSCNWSDLVLSGYTKIFRNIDLRYAGAWTPYVTDSLGLASNTFLWNDTKKLLKHRNTDWALSLNWNVNSETRKTKKSAQSPANQLLLNDPDYVNFDIPWGFNLAYTFRYSKQYLTDPPPNQKELIQTLSFNGNLTVTKNWKVGITSGFDFEQKKFSYTSINIYRDLHCWEMKFNWIPTGFRKSYNLSISVKSAVLQDLKLTKKKDWRDY